jgi:hypothetical protein
VPPPLPVCCAWRVAKTKRRTSMATAQRSLTWQEEGATALSEPEREP